MHLYQTKLNPSLWIWRGTGPMLPYPRMEPPLYIMPRMKPHNMLSFRSIVLVLVVSLALL